jgi:uncharacterized phiE125 gp8 family phage protein
MTLRVTENPTSGMVTLAQAKAQLRLEQDCDDEDAILGRLILVATGEVEAITQRRFVTQTLEWVLQHWQNCPLRLPIAPVATDGVESIAYVDLNGATQTWSAAEYVVAPDGDTVAIRPKVSFTFPLLDPDAAEPIVITFVAGTAIEAVSPLATHACLMILTELYKNRGDSLEVEASAELRQRVTSMLLPETWS